MPTSARPPSSATRTSSRFCSSESAYGMIEMPTVSVRAGNASALGSVVLRDIKRRGIDEHGAVLHHVHAQLRAAHEVLADPGLIVRERARPVMLIERRLIAPPLHDHKMPRIVERLGEHELDAAGLLPHPGLG